jgi:tetratricopeptide (TPR) repeat protein
MPAPPGRAAATLVPAAVLVAIVLALYGRVVGHGFVGFDDADYVYENPMVRAGWSTTAFAWAFTSGHAANWHPLTWLSHMTDCEIFGLWAGGHHAVSVGLHALNAVLLFLALRSSTGALGPSFVAAAVFAWHPLRVESVAWVAERKDVLCGTFWMLSLLAYARYARGPSRMRYAVVVAVFALGLMAKPMLVTLPLVLLLLDAWPLGRWRSGADLPSRLGLVSEKLPLLALSAAASAITLLTQSGAIATVGGLGAGTRVASALLATVAYLRQFVWPAGLAFFYPHPALVAGSSPVEIAAAASAAAVAVGLLSLVALRSFARRPYLAVGWLWYLVTLVPVIGLVQVGDQARADRYTYLPLVGVAVALAWGAADIVASRPRLRPAVAAVTSLALAGWSAVTWRQVDTWRDSRALYERAIEVTRGNFVAHTNLGFILEQQGDAVRAREHYALALRALPQYPLAHNNLAVLLEREGDLDRAAVHLGLALRYRPDFAAAHRNLGVVLRKQGDPVRARTHTERALELTPGDVAAHLNLALLEQEAGDLAGAVARYRRALELAPGEHDARNNLGILLTRLDRLGEAAAEFETILRENPGHVDARNNLGQCLERRGDLAGAAEHYQAALRLDPGHAKAAVNLALLLERQGDLRGAVSHYREVLRREPSHLDAGNRLAWILATSPDPTLRDGAEALAWAERCARATDYRHPAVLGTLAAALAETGDFAAAIRWQEAAAAMGDDGDGARARSRLHLLRAHRAIREP